MSRPRITNPAISSITRSVEIHPAYNADLFLLTYSDLLTIVSFPQALASGRLEGLRADADAAVEALTELNVANSTAHHLAMTDHCNALQMAESRAAELEEELEGARQQVRSAL
jgi:hypothetical protein